MPMRFAKLDGSMIDVYQATTQMTDESGQTYPDTIDTLLDRALGAEGLLRGLHREHARRRLDGCPAAAIVAPRRPGACRWFRRSRCSPGSTGATARRSLGCHGARTR